MATTATVTIRQDDDGNVDILTEFGEVFDETSQAHMFAAIAHEHLCAIGGAEPTLKRGGLQ